MFWGDQFAASAIGAFSEGYPVAVSGTLFFFSFQELSNVINMINMLSIMLSVLNMAK